MFKITKQFCFSASHQLEGLLPDHPCSRLHGHNYRVEVVLESKDTDGVGFVQDYRALHPIKTFIDESLDHQHLNDVIGVNPTAENLAKYLFELFAPDFPQLSCVRVSETEKTWAEYSQPIE